MDNETTNIGDSLKNYYIFYSAPALLNHKEREFGTVIAEANNKLIIVDDEIIREHVYLIPKTKVDHFGDQQMYFDIPEIRDLIHLIDMLLLDTTIGLSKKYLNYYS